MIFAVCVLPSVARSLMTGAAVLMCATHFLFFLVRVAVTLRHLPLTKRWTTTVRLGVRARPATVVAMVQELIRADTRVMDTVADVPLFVGGSVASTFWPLTKVPFVEPRSLIETLFAQRNGQAIGNYKKNEPSNDRLSQRLNDKSSKLNRIKTNKLNNLGFSLSRKLSSSLTHSGAAEGDCTGLLNLYLLKRTFGLLCRING